MNFCVGITHYNEVNCLNELLNCIGRSSVQPSYIFIVDDFSLSLRNLKKLINNTYDLPVYLLQNKKNFGGPSVGRNICLRKAERLKLPIFLFDADDLMPETYFEQVLTKFSNSEFAGVYSPRRKFFFLEEETRSQSATANMTPHLLFGSDKFMMNWGVSPFTMSGSFFSVPFLEQNIYFSSDPNLIAVEDLDLWIRLSDKNLISLTDFHIYYRISKGQLSRNKYKHGMKVIKVFWMHRKGIMDVTRKIIGYMIWHLLLKRFISVLCCEKKIFGDR